MLISDDLPTFDRPMTANSQYLLSGGQPGRSTALLMNTAFLTLEKSAGGSCICEPWSSCLVSMGGLPLLFAAGAFRLPLLAAGGRPLSAVAPVAAAWHNVVCGERAAGLLLHVRLLGSAKQHEAPQRRSTACERRLQLCVLHRELVDAP